MQLSWSQEHVSEICVIQLHIHDHCNTYSELCSFWAREHNSHKLTQTPCWPKNDNVIWPGSVCMPVTYGDCSTYILVGYGNREVECVMLTEGMTLPCKCCSHRSHQSLTVLYLHTAHSRIELVSVHYCFLPVPWRTKSWVYIPGRVGDIRVKNMFLS